MYIYVCFVETVVCGFRKLLVACLTWSRGCGESRTKSSLKIKDERCFVSPRCGSRMIGRRG